MIYYLHDGFLDKMKHYGPLKIDIFVNRTRYHGAGKICTRGMLSLELVNAQGRPLRRLADLALKYAAPDLGSSIWLLTYYAKEERLLKVENQ